MGFPELVLMAIGLAADSFAVSVSSGAIIGTMHLRHAFRIAFFFSFFQGLMPWIGWEAGGLAGEAFQTFDHWIAFAMLFFIGGKMIYESRNLEQEEISDPLNLYVLFTLAIATSIDALAVGVTFSFLDVSIAWPVVVIGITTFLFSFVGTYLGQYFGHLFENKIELVGGLILIGIGCKILIEHLLAG